MSSDINHDIKNKKIIIIEDGNEAYVEYTITNDRFDIVHTFVPHPMEGKGMASILVKFAYDYARREGLQLSATCSYAKVWLSRHSDYMLTSTKEKAE